MALTDNLQLALTFEGTGSHLGDDKSGLGNNLTNHGSVAQAAGNASPGSNSATFPASNTVYLGNSGPVINLSNTDWTITCWVYPMATVTYDMFVVGQELYPTHQYAIW